MPAILWHRWLAVVFFTAAAVNFGVEIYKGERIGPAFWIFLSMGLLALASVFLVRNAAARAWVAGVPRYVAPRLARGGAAAGRFSLTHPALVAAVVCGAIAIGFLLTGKVGTGLWILLVAVLLAVLHFKGIRHFADQWKEYWLGISVFGALHSLMFGEWMAAFAFAISALAAGITLYGDWGKTARSTAKGISAFFASLAKVLFNGYGGVAAMVGWFVAFFVLGFITQNHQETAKLFFALSGACFFLAVWMGARKSVDKMTSK